MKTIFKGILVTVLSVIAISSAYANWQCRVQNARGQVWFGVAPTRSGASATAVGFCSRGSNQARNCVISYCRAGNYGPGLPSAIWQCNASNARGQWWYGTGPSRSIAASNATRVCTSHSAYARNCMISSCFIKR